MNFYKETQKILCPKFFSEQVDRLSWQNEDIEENIENLESTINEKI